VQYRLCGCGRRTLLRCKLMHRSQRPYVLEVYFLWRWDIRGYTMQVIRLCTRHKLRNLWVEQRQNGSQRCLLHVCSRVFAVYRAGLNHGFLVGGGNGRGLGCDGGDGGKLVGRCRSAVAPGRAKQTVRAYQPRLRANALLRLSQYASVSLARDLR
jgi:hypothetical protein